MGIKIHPFSITHIFIHKQNNSFMKPEYKMRAQENLEAIAKRAKVISEMLNGERPVNQDEAKRATKEIERLVELTTNIVDLS